MTRIVAPGPEIRRDRWGRPLVTPPEGGKPVAYTRCTTYVGSVEDTYNLSRWQMRMVALGLADRRDLLLAAAAHRDDKTKLNKVCEDALEAAKGHAAATTGTALHAITETHDRGNSVGILPDEAKADLDAYVAATTALKPIHIEQFMVLDRLKIGGTPDRISRYSDGKRYVTDLKTGSIEFGFLKIAAQLAVYARSTPYDVEAGRRMDHHGAELDKGIIIHLPAGSATCTLYWVDLLAGWEVVRLAKSLREKRAWPSGSLYTPVVSEVPPLADRITTATSPDAVRALWRDHASEWTDELTQLAKTHISHLTEGANA